MIPNRLNAICKSELEPYKYFGSVWIDNRTATPSFGINAMMALFSCFQEFFDIQNFHYTALSYYTFLLTARKRCELLIYNSRKDTI